VISRSGSIHALALAAALISGAPAVASSQEAGDTVPQPVLVVDTVHHEISPRGAMIRSFALWGWGQAAVGSYVRGGVWFSMYTATGYMLLKTIARLNIAKDTRDRVETWAADSLNHLIATDSAAAEDLSDPNAFEQALSEAPGVQESRDLVTARTQHRQDWITYAIFFTIMSGVDAYVNAHLEDFPTTIATEARPDGSVSLSVRVPLPAWLGGTDRGTASGSLRASRPRRW
jgi:hypothetical protein